MNVITHVSVLISLWIAVVVPPSTSFVFTPRQDKPFRLIRAETSIASAEEPEKPQEVLSSLTDDLRRRYKTSENDVRFERRSELLQLLKQTPSNAPTSRTLTKDILTKLDELEELCPTPDSEVLKNLAGNWELLWTTQDRRSEEWRLNPFGTWINPLENQAYSNNPDGEAGRANPFLPRRIQDRLERLGFTQGSARSSQLIDLEKERIRNIVTFRFPGRRQRQATLFVDINIKPSGDDSRRVDVKFKACRLLVPNSRIDIMFPLGRLGPTGWVRTSYIDDSIRITRGHKGSVFVLSRAGIKRGEQEDSQSSSSPE